MSFELIYLVVGLILVLVALSKPFLGERPITAAMLYLAIGALLSPRALGFLPLDPVANADLLLRVSELAVVTSLFVCGLKLQVGWSHQLWRSALRLAFISMTLTVAAVSLSGTLLMGFPLGVALILGAVLAPTDPVLASEVQVDGADDRDPVRFSLTGEAGFNDGSAFPFLYLGLGFLGLHSLGPWWSSWWLIDVLWGVLGGLAVGAILGAIAGRLVRRLKAESQAEGVHEFLAFGLVFSAYGVALALHTHAFLAAFTAGVALRGSERRERNDEVAMSPGVLGFKERIERLLEALIVILVGALVVNLPWDRNLIWFVPLLFLVFRPLAVMVGLLGAPVSRIRKRYMAWLGIRGIGSVYYLSYAISQGLPETQARQLSSLVYPVLACSIIVHGLSVSPLMGYYEQTTDSERRTA
jgi:NhaP-type Na+/H+ or K+/H+ antiporter